MSSSESTSASVEPRPDAARPLKRLRVIHRTTYRYDAAVRQNSNDVRKRPLNTPWQRCDFFLLKVTPPTRLQHFVDLHLNRVTHFEVDGIHEKLVVEAISDVRTWRKIDFEAFPYGVTFAELAGCKHELECCEFLNASPLVDPTPAVWRIAVDIRADTTDVYQTAFALMEHIHANFDYRPGVTSAQTHASEAVSLKAGVCQDFAHVLLALCRSLGIPARYVSGYLYDPSRGRMRGAHASHAWVEVYLPGRGWYGLDPTNRRVIDEYYIKVAIGRDYRDVAPVQGSFYGSSSHAMSVAVDISEV